MKNLKNKRGITLIALVITVIVLLILAGVTISLTIGQDGIITTAAEAEKKYVQAYNNEQAQLDDLFSETEEILRGTNTGGEEIDDATMPPTSGEGTNTGEEEIEDATMPPTSGEGTNTGEEEIEDATMPPTSGEGTNTGGEEIEDATMPPTSGEGTNT